MGNLSVDKMVFHFEIFLEKQVHFILNRNSESFTFLRIIVVVMYLLRSFTRII